MIRRATLEDVPFVAQLGLRFITASDMPEGEIGECEAFCSWLINNENGAAFVGDEGVIAGYVAPLYYRPDYLQAHECFWWSEKGEGLALLKAFESWAISKGANEILASSLSEFSSPTVSKLLARKGYVPREVNYVKKGLH